MKFMNRAPLLDAATSVIAGIDSAADTGMTIVKHFVNTVVVWFSAAIIAAFMVFFIVSAVNKHKANDEYKDDIIKIIVAIVGIGLVLSFPTWGWKLMDSSSSAATAASFFMTRMW
ncbi:hypothetical protein [Marasmitruncus massiliensis]|uniref:hypothetical protein n=1 Tax=Marasmitruncus massiliensis TaxID=1944642 RepID=UPI000C79FDB9|nr:hypothetical protein [Marasmitruncus massiliensis]